MAEFPTVVIDQLFPEGADAMVDLCERFGRYGMYSQENVESEIGQGLGQRHDSVLNFVKTGGRFGRHEDLKTLARRTNYFREEYAYGQRTLIDGIEPYLNHEAFLDAARFVHQRPIVEPAIVFANLMVPGQELATHTDVPEFRGANRKVMPQWLLVAMHHSGLFEPWRMPIATGVAWFHDCDGGEFAYYPDGAFGDAVAHKVASNTALVFDADSVFHGVDRIASSIDDMPPLKPGMHLVYDGDKQWVALAGDDTTEIARYKWEELRFSVSWKAYCFTDEAERDRWKSNTDDLRLDVVLNKFIADLRARERILGPIPSQSELALMIIDEYIVFPPV
ncbi:MAG: hypothetical protein Q8K63_09685 [Acidimicrobiales bacterium]|nr:hypothetical protein [Acidimicrobiales bacterium]